MNKFLSLIIRLSLVMIPVILLSACSTVSTDIDIAIDTDIQPDNSTTPIIERTVEPFTHPNLQTSAITITQPTQTINLLVPLYQDPINNPEDWQKIADAASKVSVTVIINPSSGPAGCQTQTFQDALNLVTSRGVTVLGYVSTGFGFRDVGLVQQDITSYQACPQVGGIFLDEVSRETSQADNIRSLCSYVRGAPNFASTVLNVGTSVANSILEFPYCDIVVSFEKDISQWVFSYDADSVTFPNANLFATLIHSTATESIYQAVDLARARGYGFMHISSDALPNPWSKLPVFWESLINYIELGNGITQEPVAPTTPAPTTAPNTNLVNTGFDNFEGWLNCGDPSSYFIGNSALNLSAGSCVYQTITAVPGRSYTLTCAGNTSGNSWNTFILSSLDSNYQSMRQDFKPITSTRSSQSITMTAPSNAAHIAVGFYSEGTANYTSCTFGAGENVTPTAPVNSTLINPSFNNFEGWANCGSSNSYFIANGNLNLTSGACVYQTIPASANRTYTLTCKGNINESTWSTFILSALNSNWGNITQVFQPLTLNNSTNSITINAPAGTAHMAVSFYTEGSATYQECSIN